MIVLSNKAKAAHMEEQHSGISIAVTRSLERAALLPHRRDELISHALEHLLTSISAVGTALIWPCRNRTVPWKVYYAGIKRTAMHRWLCARLDPSLDVTVGVLQHDLTHGLAEMPPPLLMRLGSLPSSPRAIWILWTSPKTEPSLPGAVRECIERVRQTLEAVLEVEEREAHLFTSSSPLYDRDLIEALVHGDPHALSTFLSLTRVVAAADFAFWGSAYPDVVEVTSYLGAKHGGFGFALPRGHGVGGRVIAYGEPIALPDYRNSPYRHPSVSDIVDAEEIRSGMAVPVHAASSLEQQGPVAAVLYATRRTVAPFSMAERLLVQRQAHLLEPLSLEVRSASFFLPGVQQLAENVVLDHLKSPPIFFDDDMAVILLEGQMPQDPSKVRDALLTHCGTHPLWIVQGGHYHSLQDLKTTLTHTLSLARKARRDNYGEYLLDISAFGLDSLLENPRLAGDLDTFARRLLTPLLEYDAANSSHLTKTFVLAQTLGSAQAVAEQLGVHVNTIRYRLRRAEDLLGTDQASPKEHAAFPVSDGFMREGKATLEKHLSDVTQTQFVTHPPDDRK